MTKKSRAPTTPPSADILPLEHIQSQIRVLRGLRVMLDSDLAALYGVSTKRLLEQVRRNPSRFPDDFCFQLEREELANLRSQNATSSSGHGGRRFLPYAFTEHGAIMAANVLNSEAATVMSVAVVRAFIQLRQLVVNHKAIAAKLAALESRIGQHDGVRKHGDGVVKRSVTARGYWPRASLTGRPPGREGEHDQLAAIVEAIRLLTTPETQPPRRRIGFHRD